MAASSFPRHQAFTLLVKMDGCLREVNFSKCSESLYDANMVDARGERHLFQWTLQDDLWMAVAPKGQALPPMIVNDVKDLREKFLLGINTNR